jgi:hypothetical protein
MSPLDLLNKIIGAIIAYGPKNKTKKGQDGEEGSTPQKTCGNETRLANY